MADYYNHNIGGGGGGGESNSRQQYDYKLSAPPVELCFLLAVVLGFLCFTWYINYESMWEDLMNQLKLGLMVFPVLLLVLVHWLSSSSSSSSSSVLDQLIPLPDQDSIHRAGGSPWGVGLLLILLVFMISYHTSIQERWFPLLAR